MQRQWAHEQQQEGTATKRNEHTYRGQLVSALLTAALEAIRIK